MRQQPPALHPSDVVNDANHGAVLTVVAAYCMTTALIFLCGRFGVRWPWTRCCGKDDALAAIASLFGIAQMITICTAVNAGFGKLPGELTTGELVKVDRLLYTSNLLWTITTYLGRLSVIFLQRRLSGSESQSRLASRLAVACGVCWLASFLTLALQHDDVAPWLRVGRSDSNMFARWVAAEVLGCLVDLAIVAYIIHLVWNMQTRRDKKRLVVILFSLRLPLIAVAIARLHSMHISLNSPAASFTYITTAIYTQIELSYNLVSATTPVLRIFLRAARTGVHGTVTHTSLIDYIRESSGFRQASGYPHSSNRGSLGTRLSSMHRRSMREDDEELAIELTNPNHGQTVTTAVAGSGKTSMASDGDDSDAIVVRQKIDITYDLLEA